MFQLNPREKDEVVTKCDHLRKLKHSPNLPFAFTEHGAVMLASVLNSPITVQASIAVVRAFLHLREILATHKSLARKLATNRDCTVKATDEKYSRALRKDVRKFPQKSQPCRVITVGLLYRHTQK